MAPAPDLSGVVQRHVDMTCQCWLLDCCHTEDPDWNYSFRACTTGPHVDHGDPATGGLWPWPPGATPWKDDPLATVAVMVR